MPFKDSGTMFVKPVTTDQPIDVVIPCHDRLELTIQCVNSLYANTSAPMHLIVVDDSTDKITRLYWKEMKKRFTNITYIYSKEPYKEGNQYLNIAFSHAKHPYIACVGNSMRVETEWEVSAINILEKNPEVGIVGFKCLFPNGAIESAGIAMAGSRPIDVGRDLLGHRLSRLYECDAVQWAFAMVRKEAVTNPPMPEGVFNGFVGWDDIDNCLVLRKRGWKVVYTGFGVGFHQPRATRGSNEPDRLEANQQNARRFYKRWGWWEQFLETHPGDWPEGKEGAVPLP